MRNGVWAIGQLAFVGLFVVDSAGLSNAQSPPLWGKLSPGSYGVGFRTVWQLDYSRRYNTTFADKTTYATGKAPRPILINIWYPAKAAGNGKTMRHRDYLEVRSAEPSLAKLSGALADYVMRPYTQEPQGKPDKEALDRDKRVQDELLNTPTPCFATPRPRRGHSPW